MHKLNSFSLNEHLFLLIVDLLAPNPIVTFYFHVCFCFEL